VSTQTTWYAGHELGLTQRFFVKHDFGEGQTLNWGHELDMKHSCAPNMSYE
jgi:hypothetical protein